MARLKTTIAPTMTTTVTTSVKLSPNARTMVKQRCEEHAELGKQVKKAKDRQERIRGEIDELFMKEKQGKALVDGCEVEDHKIKLVTGTTRKLDEVALMKAYGISREELDGFYDEKPKKPYISLKSPGEEKGEE